MHTQRDSSSCSRQTQPPTRLTRLRPAAVCLQFKGSLLVSSAKSSSQWDLAHDAEDDLTKRALSIIVIGASGDLAVKKTFPALFSLFCAGLLPPHFLIAGFARSAIAEDQFKKKVSAKFPARQEARKADFPASVLLSRRPVRLA